MDITKLENMVLDLKVLEVDLDSNSWNDEDKVLKYNELQDEILDYLKSVL